MGNRVVNAAMARKNPVVWKWEASFVAGDLKPKRQKRVIVDDDLDAAISRLFPVFRFAGARCRSSNDVSSPARSNNVGFNAQDVRMYLVGARMFYNSRDMLWNQKLEEQADLQQAIELQNRRLMGLQLLDVKRNSHHHHTLSTGAAVSPPATFSPTSFGGQNVVVVEPSNPSSPVAKEVTFYFYFFSYIRHLIWVNYQEYT